MSRQQQKLIDRIFTRALELSGNERQAYLDDACPDVEVHSTVLALLDAATSNQLDQRIDAVRERLWSEVFAADESNAENLAGQRFGNWRIEQRLARGGLATVYLAHRDDGEFDQKAAFKVLRRGLDTDDVIARFRAERQILSSLDHPSIAQILDGGALPDGRPFLVLEYVDGEMITNYCKRLNVDIRGCVTLMIDVLRGLHHAHRHTVVHRDIKPSNILVSTEGNVALLDFGIAKLLDPRALPGSSTMTRTGVSLLTPGYGSPEQRAGEAVTTASDIYQAGMVLYEMLTGRRPEFANQDGQPVDAQPPSKQLQGTPRYRQVHGDLDAITLKAMQADPARRYGSANEMVNDLERFLDGRPVLAQPDTLAYRFTKLTGRRPWLLPGMAMAALGLVAYVVTLTLYSRQLQLEEQRAEAAQAFMVDLLSSPDPFAPADPERGRNITVVEALDIGRSRLENQLDDQLELRATLLGSVAGVYRSLDQNQEAIELGEQALALNLELYGEQSEAVLENLRLLADRYQAAGDNDQAHEYATKQLDIARSMYDRDAPKLGIAEIAAGMIENSQANIDTGLGLLASGIDKLRTAPESHAEMLITGIIRSTEQEGMNDAADSLALLEEGLAVAESVLGADSIYAAELRIAIGRNLLFLHERNRSERNYNQGLRVLEQKLGRQHAATIKALQDYGEAMNVSGDHAASEAIFVELVERLVEQHGEQHKSVADNYQNLATTITYQGRYDESVPLHRKAYGIYKSVLNDDNYMIAFPLLSIASIEVERENAQAADAAASEALERLRASVPGTYVEGVALCLVGLALEQQGRVAEGSTMVEASHELILKRDVLVPKYLTLCRVPEAAQSLPPA